MIHGDFTRICIERRTSSVDRRWLVLKIDNVCRDRMVSPLVHTCVEMSFADGTPMANPVARMHGMSVVYSTLLKHWVPIDKVGTHCLMRKNLCFRRWS